MPTVVLRTLALLCLTAVLWAVGIGAARASAPDTGIPLRACVARDAPGMTLSDILGRRVPLDCATPQHTLGPGDYWVVSPLPATLPVADLDIRIASLWQRAITIHAIFADGHVERLRRPSGELSQHLQLGAIVEFSVPHYTRAPLRTIVWKVEGSANRRGIVLSPTLMTRLQSERANVQLGGLYAGFAGLAIALLVYHLAMWGALRHRFQIAYCLMVSVLLFYAVSSSGALAWLAPSIDNNDRMRLNYVALGLAAASAFWFARTFFEERVFAGWLAPVVRASIAVLALSGPMFALVSLYDMGVADRLYSWAFLAAITTIVPILWRAWRERSDFLWLFALAWAAPIVFAFARVLSAMHYLPVSFWLDNSTVLSMAAEALLSSLAIAYRVHRLSRERDEAIVRETIARRLADTDVLTGLLNRRAFLNAAIGREGVHALHVVDIDHFKRINDTLGHDGGDEVLRVIARVLRQAVPDNALVARIGGEEFAILLPVDQPFEPEAVLAALRAARMPFDLEVTASVGSCSGPMASDLDWKSLYHCADRALFAAKSAGRDRARRGPLTAAA